MRTIRWGLVVAVTWLATTTANAQHNSHANAVGHHGLHNPHVGGSISLSVGTWPRYFGAYGGYGLSYGSPYYSGYGYLPYGSNSFAYGYASPYGTYYAPSSNYVEYYLPPVYYPAELAYGPQAVKQFMGLDRNFALGPLAAGAAAIPTPAPAPAGPRVSNLETLRRARKYIDIGDRLFLAQEFHSALQQYKTASKTAPDLADAYIRQGFALLATGRYEFAVEAFRRGLSVDPKYAHSDFRLDAIYGDSRAAKTAHLETLAATALDRADDADLLFLLGMFLHFDGQADRAQRFFLRAAALERGEAGYIRAFVTPPDATEPAIIAGRDA